MITINLNESEFDMRLALDYIQQIRNTGLLVYQVLPDGDKKLVADLRQSPMIGDVNVEDWAFPVRIIYGEEELYAALLVFGFRMEAGFFPKGNIGIVLLSASRLVSLLGNLNAAVVY